MHVSAIIHFGRWTSPFLGAAAAAVLVTLSTGVRAESAYVSQIARGAVVDVPFTELIKPHRQQTLQYAAHQVAMPLPEVASPHDQNIARTAQIGSYNTALQLQSGINNSSNVGIIGAYNSVAVLQSGNNLRSNVVLLNTLGMNVGVLQPKGSAPVNILIARLPGGGLLIKR